MYNKKRYLFRYGIEECEIFIFKEVDMLMVCVVLGVFWGIRVMSWSDYYVW